MRQGVTSARSPGWTTRLRLPPSRPPRRLESRLPTTAAGAETVLVTLVVGMRAGTLVQMAPSAANGAATSPRPGLYLLTWVVAALASVVVVTLAVRRRRPPGPVTAAVDVALAAVLLLVGTMTVAPTERLGTWEGFQPAYALTVLLTASTVFRGAAWFVVLGTVLAASMIYLDGAVAVVGRPSVVGHLLTYLVLGAVANSAVRYVRRMAADADEARGLAAELGRREEERRAQSAFHNGAAVMRLLADPDLDPGLRARLQEQALLEARHMRSYLRGRGPAVAAGPEGDDPTLPQALAVACRAFADLPLEHALELAPPVRVGAEQRVAVVRAVTSLLLNVRQHAGAGFVLVDLDAPVRAEDGGPEQAGWVLTVLDDGVGFDPGTVRPGVGLGRLVLADLRAQGLDVDLTSSPGRGTTVTVTARAGLAGVSATGPGAREVR